jgi:hypothetical protein
LHPDFTDSFTLYASHIFTPSFHPKKKILHMDFHPKKKIEKQVSKLKQRNIKRFYILGRFSIEFSPKNSSPFIKRDFKNKNKK